MVLLKTHHYLAIFIVVFVVLAALWPLVVRAVTSDEVDYYNSPTEYTALLASTGAPEAPTSPAVRFSGSNKPQVLDSAIQAKIEAEFGAGHIMYWVAVNESQLDPSAKNPRSSASGVFQITNGTFAGCEGSVFNADDNIKCAKKIYEKRGLQPWEASRNHGFDGGWGKRL